MTASLDDYYRVIKITLNHANDPTPTIRLAGGDIAGRVLEVIGYWNIHDYTPRLAYNPNPDGDASGGWIDPVTTTEQSGVGSVTYFKLPRAIFKSTHAVLAFELLDNDQNVISSRRIPVIVEPPVVNADGGEAYDGLSDLHNAVSIANEASSRATEAENTFNQAVSDGTAKMDAAITKGSNDMNAAIGQGKADITSAIADGRQRVTDLIDSVSITASSTEVTPATTPSVTKTGDGVQANFDFSLPRAPRVDAYADASEDGTASVTSTGDENGDVTFHFKLPRGASIGTVSTRALDPDATPTATTTRNGGTGDWNLELGIPRGERGEQGPAGGPKGDPALVVNRQLQGHWTSACSDYTWQTLNMNRKPSVGEYFFAITDAGTNLMYAKVTAVSGDTVAFTPQSNTSIKGSDATVPIATTATPGKVYADFFPDSGLKVESNGRLHLRPAGKGILGGISVGQGLNVSDAGELSVSSDAVPVATSTTPGKVYAINSIDSGLVLESNGRLHVKPATSSSIGGVIVGDGLLVADDGTVQTSPTVGSQLAGQRAVYTTSYQISPGNTNGYLTELTPKPTSDNPLKVGDLLILPDKRIGVVNYVDTGNEQAYYGIGGYWDAVKSPMVRLSNLILDEQGYLYAGTGFINAEAMPMPAVWDKDDFELTAIGYSKHDDSLTGFTVSAEGEANTLASVFYTSAKVAVTITSLSDGQTTTEDSVQVASSVINGNDAAEVTLSTGIHIPTTGAFMMRLTIVSSPAIAS